MYSSAGNRTPVSRVTGGDTHHYTTEDILERCQKFICFFVKPKPTAILWQTAYTRTGLYHERPWYVSYCVTIITKKLRSPWLVSVKKVQSLNCFQSLQIAHGHTHTLFNVIYVRRANLARYRTQVQTALRLFWIQPVVTINKSNEGKRDSARHQWDLNRWVLFNFIITKI